MYTTQGREAPLPRCSPLSMRTWPSRTRYITPRRPHLCRAPSRLSPLTSSVSSPVLYRQQSVMPVLTALWGGTGKRGSGKAPLPMLVLVEQSPLPPLEVMRWRARVIDHLQSLSAPPSRGRYRASQVTARTARPKPWWTQWRCFSGWAVSPPYSNSYASACPVRRRWASGRTSSPLTSPSPCWPARWEWRGCRARWVAAPSRPSWQACCRRAARLALRWAALGWPYREA
mmetsp:Transcript_1943/g.4083  ORF Transcript_1943/g.4083 Transcript_1943/m.4083 type:complete len:229 (+) Transcript_1943:754-1440(+)